MLLPHRLRDIQTAYCHVFHIHVSLPLQLGYYLPVEPLQLEGKEGEVGPGRGEKTGQIRNWVEGRVQKFDGIAVDNTQGRYQGAKTEKWRIII